MGKGIRVFLFLILGMFLISFVSAEYHIDIYADAVTGAAGSVTVTDLGNGVFRVNATDGDYEVDRALVMKWLFYGGSGRATSTYMTNITAVTTNDTRDIGKRGIYAYAQSGGFNGKSYYDYYNGVFVNTITNYNISSWSHTYGNYDGRTSGIYELAKGTIINSGFDSNELETDTHLDQKDNMATLAIGALDNYGGKLGTTHLIILTNNAITWTPDPTYPVSSYSNIDFYINESFPLFEDIVTVTLNSPNDSLIELTDTNIVFNATAIIGSIKTLSNITLYINDILNETKSLSGTEDTETFTKSFSSLGDYNWSVKVCDNKSICTFSDTRDFEIRLVIEDNLVYDTSIIEGELNTFSVDAIVVDGSSLTSAIFNYNGANYTTSISYSSGTYSLSSSINVPLVSSDTNITFSFFVVVDGITYQFLENNQTILDIVFSICGVASSDLLLNLSLMDEITGNSLNGDIEINADIISKTSGNTVETLSTKFENVSTASICFSPPSSYPLYYLSAEIKYNSNGYASEFYFIQQADMEDYPQNLSLYDLNLSSSTEFLIKYQDDNLITVEGAVIQLLRKYIGEDIFRVVEAPLTSDIGTVIAHIDLNTNLYKAIVVKDGVILDIFDNLVFHCENELSGQCTENLFGSINPQNSVSVDTINDFSYAITSVNNTVTTTFSIPSGTPATINIVLAQKDTFGNEYLCNKTITSSAGSIDCDYEDTIGDSMVNLYISKNGVQQVYNSYFIAEAGAIDWLGNNFFIVFILLLSIVGMAMASPEWMIINAVATMILCGGVWLLAGLDFVAGLGTIVWLLVTAFILIFKISKQEDR